MDLNQLTRDADDLIRKVVSRYNQLYFPAGNISQLELDLMLDDMRKLYDTFKIIGQVNLTFQHNTNKQEVSVNTAVQSDLQNKDTTSQTHDVKQVQATEPASAISEPEPEPEFDTEPESRAEPDDETALETTLIPEVKEPVLEEKEPEPNAQTKPVIEPAPEPAPKEQAIDKSEISESENPAQRVSGINSISQNPEPSPAMLADRFNAGNKSLSETMASSQKQGVVGSRLLFHPITDLSTGIGLNDKFSFISELFGNNPLQYDEAISRINKAVNADEANWILQKYHTADWDQKSETLTRLKDFVKRRFI